jgi:hypothetical protein
MGKQFDLFLNWYRIKKYSLSNTLLYVYNTIRIVIYFGFKPWTYILKARCPQAHSEQLFMKLNNYKKNIYQLLHITIVVHEPGPQIWATGTILGD